jgi:Synergist-CTERM protein sorting domain-containing protein
VGGAGLLIGLWLAGVARASCEDTAAPWDTGVEQGVDCDGDGVTPAEGDCDDRDASIGPGRPEVCGDRLDNDCNGLYDDGCDRALERGRLGGGAGCVSGGGAGAALLLLLPLGLRRRR